MAKKIGYIWHFVCRHKYIVTVVLFVALVGFLDPNSFLARYEIDRQNARLREQIKTLDADYLKAQAELKRLENDPSAVERVARFRLFMRTNNEDVYVIEDSTAKSADNHNS